MMEGVNSVFDIGAHVGSFTERALQMGAQSVLAVEPQPDIYKKLAERYAQDSRVKTLRKCVLDVHNSVVEFWVCRQATTLSSANRGWATETRFKEYAWEEDPIYAETVTLDALIEEYGEPDYIKIDVEGCEFIVLSGLTVPVERISFEFDYETMITTKKCIDRLLEISDYEFTFSIGDFFGDSKIPFSDGMLAFQVSKSVKWGMFHARLK